MRVLITGGQGFLGLALSKKLEKRGHYVASYDLKVLGDMHCNYIYNGSVLDKDRLDNILEYDNFDVVVHAAALLGVARTDSEPLETLDVIVQGTRNVCLATTPQRIADYAGTDPEPKPEDYKPTRKYPRLVYLSSSEVYGAPPHGVYVSEDMDVMPRTPYAAAKLCAEYYVREYFGKWSIVRPFNIYGPGQKSDFVVKNMMQRAIAGEPIPVYGNGAQVRAFCHIDDFTEGLARIVEGGADGHIVNLGNPEPCRMQALAVNVKIAVQQVFGRFDSEIVNVPYEQSDRKESREIDYRVPDIYWARQYLDWAPKTTLPKGLVKMAEAMKSNGA